MFPNSPAQDRRFLTVPTVDGRGRTASDVSRNSSSGVSSGVVSSSANNSPLLPRSLAFNPSPLSGSLESLASDHSDATNTIPPFGRPRVSSGVSGDSGDSGLGARHSVSSSNTKYSTEVDFARKNYPYTLGASIIASIKACIFELLETDLKQTPDPQLLGGDYEGLPFEVAYQRYIAKIVRTLYSFQSNEPFDAEDLRYINDFYSNLTVHPRSPKTTKKLKAWYQLKCLIILMDELKSSLVFALKEHYKEIIRKKTPESLMSSRYSSVMHDLQATQSQQAIDTYQHKINSDEYYKNYIAPLKQEAESLQRILSTTREKYNQDLILLPELKEKIVRYHREKIDLTNQYENTMKLWRDFADHDRAVVAEGRSQMQLNKLAYESKQRSLAEQDRLTRERVSSLADQDMYFLAYESSMPVLRDFSDHPRAAVTEAQNETQPTKSAYENIQKSLLEQDRLTREYFSTSSQLEQDIYLAETELAAIEKRQNELDFLEQRYKVIMLNMQNRERDCQSRNPMPSNMLVECRANLATMTHNELRTMIQQLQTDYALYCHKREELIAGIKRTLRQARQVREQDARVYPFEGDRNSFKQGVDEKTIDLVRIFIKLYNQLPGYLSQHKPLIEELRTKARTLLARPGSPSVRIPKVVEEGMRPRKTHSVVIAPPPIASSSEI